MPRSPRCPSLLLALRFSLLKSMQTSAHAYFRNITAKPLRMECVGLWMARPQRTARVQCQTRVCFGRRLNKQIVQFLFELPCRPHPTKRERKSASIGGACEYEHMPRARDLFWTSAHTRIWSICLVLNTAEWSKNQHRTCQSVQSCRIYALACVGRWWAVIYAWRSLTQKCWAHAMLACDDNE